MLDWWKQRTRLFYGWWVVLACTLGTTLSGGLYMYGFSTFFIPLIREFGWTRAELSGALSLARLEGGLVGPLQGFMVDRLGPRLNAFLGVALMGTGFIVISRVGSLPTFYAAFIGLIALGSSSLFVVGSASMAYWFIKKRSLVMGINTAGFNLGGMMAPLIALLISLLGWRQASFLLGFVAYLFAIPILLLLRDRPEKYGYLPDGEQLERAVLGADRTSVAKGANVAEVNFLPQEALRTRTFWCASTMFALRVAVSSVIGIHLVPFFTDIGLAAELAASLLALMAAIALPSRLMGGWLGDRWDKRYVMSGYLGITIIALILLSRAASLGQAIAFILVYAPAYGGGGPLMPAMIAEYFGRRFFGTINGFAQGIMTFGTVLGPLFAGWVFDLTGSYRRAFLILAFLCGIAIALTLAVTRPRRPLPQPSSVSRERLEP